jgi:hypothetical protein
MVRSSSSRRSRSGATAASISARTTSRASSATTRRDGSGGGEDRMPEGRGGGEVGATEGRGGAAEGGAALGLDGGGATVLTGGGLLVGGLRNCGLCIGGGSAAKCPFCPFAMICLPRRPAFVQSRYRTIGAPGGQRADRPAARRGMRATDPPATVGSWRSANQGVRRWVPTSLPLHRGAARTASPYDDRYGTGQHVEHSQRWLRRS